MTLETPPGNSDSQNRPPPPLHAYNVNGSKTSSSQNGYSPDWSLEHRGLSEGKSNEVWMEQWRHLTEMVCWPDVSSADLQPSESCSHADSPYRFIPPFLAPGFVPCGTQYRVVEMNFVSLPLEQSIFTRNLTTTDGLQGPRPLWHLGNPVFLNVQTISTTLCFLAGIPAATFSARRMGHCCVLL